MIKQKEMCCGCGACVNACPNNSIVLACDDEGFTYPSVNQNTCINCGSCERSCPMINQVEISDDMGLFYGARARDDVRRYNSSSGGVFSCLAERIMENGGTVVSPVFDNNYVLHHALIQDVSTLQKAIGSKYVQSDVGFAYRDTKKRLDNKEVVFFSGTTCQIAGLKRYLKKEYVNLYTQDIICHGVPSPLLWKKYIEKIEKESGKIEQVFFRDKTKGWRNYSLRVDFLESDSYCMPWSKDPYLKAYSRDLSSRLSCFFCPFKGDKRESDLTLGDFWGIEKTSPSRNDDKGTTLVIIHSAKGAKLFNEIKDKLDYWEVDSKCALDRNQAALKSAVPSTKRDQFFRYLRKNGVEKALRKFTTDSFFLRTKRLIKKYIK